MGGLRTALALRRQHPPASRVAEDSKWVPCGEAGPGGARSDERRATGPSLAPRSSFFAPRPSPPPKDRSGVALARISAYSTFVLLSVVRRSHIPRLSGLFSASRSPAPLTSARA